MQNTLIVFLLIHLVFIGSLVAAETPVLPVAFIAMLLVNTFLHMRYCVNGSVPPYVLPLSWATCIVTVNVYCYLVMRRPGGFFGRDFAALVYTIFLLAPASYQYRRQIFTA